MSERWGGRFVGRTLLSIATTLPEIGIVIAATKVGSYDAAIGSALGSNLFMMTLGLSVMLVIATTRLSKAPQICRCKGVQAGQDPSCPDRRDRGSYLP